MDASRRTPLYDRHVALGGKMVEFGGWALPVSYSTILAEHQAVRTACGLFDVSHMGEITCQGQGALAFLNRLCVNDFRGLENGRCRYSPMCYENGTTVDDLIVYKKAEASYLIIVNASNCEKDFAWMLHHQTADMTLVNISDTVAQLALQGPLYREVLAKAGVTGTLPDKTYAFTEDMTIAGYPCLVSTTGYTGEPGVEIYLDNAAAPLVHQALIAAGAVPCGLGCRDTLRFESAMPLYGHELSDAITPVECGLKSFIALDKPDFIGKEPLLKPRKRMRIGLRLIDRGIAREHCAVYDQEGNEIGFTTSAGPAPTLGGNYAMALVKVSAAQSPRFFIDVRGRRIAAERVKLPFFKTENT